MATKIRKSREEAIEYARNTRRPLETRVPTGPDDYGDVPTVGLQMKRNGFIVGATVPVDDSFGVYLGQHPDGFVIMIWDVFFRPIAAEVFQTIEDMKKDWSLD